MNQITMQDRILQRVMDGSILSLAIGFIMLGIANVTVDQDSPGWQVVKYVFAVVLIGSAYIWCLFDSELHDYPFGKYMMIPFVLMLPVAIAIYFYQSRGFQKGSIALMKAAGLFALFLILGAVSGVITRRILELAF